MCGNGGLSLRSKDVMIKVIDTINIKNTVCNSSTRNYMNTVNLTVVPEDVYFSKNIIDYNLGIVAQYDVAKRFSIESIYHDGSFGGHGFWLCDPNWKNNLYKNVIIQVNPDKNLISSLNDYEHRGGWKFVINGLIRSDFFDMTCKSHFNFIDLLEAYCWGNRQFVDNDKPTVCIIHGTIEKRLEIENDWCQLKHLLHHSTYKKIQDKIIYQFTFTDHVRNYLIDNNYFKCNTISVLRHPLDLDIDIKFTMEKFIRNADKYIVQLGQQQRFYDTIYKLRILGLKKIWLPGTKTTHLKEQYKSDLVEIRYIDDYREYDEFITKNILLCHVIDANANNSIIECIVREIPILVNKHPAIVEYLGSEYPFYFKTVEEIPLLLTYNKIQCVHNYLKNLNKDFLSFRNFSGQIFDTICKIKTT